jgi:hypothetical protein
MNADERGWDADAKGHGGMRHALRSTAGALALLAALFVLVAWTPSPPNANAGRLIALVRDPVMATEYLARVDAVTGAVTPIGDGLVNCCTPVSLDAALDSEGRRYYAVMTLDTETTPRVVSFDADTGAATVGGTLATTAALNFLAYDHATSRLLALLFDTGANRQRLASVAPATGAITWLGNGIANCCSVTTALDAALDPDGRLLYAVMRPFTGTQAVLYGFDVDSGDVTLATPLAATASVNFLTFDPDRNGLLAVANDPQSDAQRLATLATPAGALGLIGEGAANCCNLFPTDAAIDAGAGNLVVPMLDGNADTRFYSFALASGDVMHMPPGVGSYTIHFIAYLPAPAHALFLPAVQNGQAPIGGRHDHR